MTAVGSAVSGDRQHGLLRDVLAVVITALACPGAMVGGALLNCAADQGFGYDCALEGITFSPFLLVGAGVVAGLLTRGWRGYALTFLGVILGMVGILVLSFLAGNLVLIGPVEAIIATFWFGAPVTLGYGIARSIAWVARRVSA